MRISRGKPYFNIMAKELPYFRFTASEWLNDDISLESYEIKGLFADVCSYYWMQDCNVTLDKLTKRFSNATILLQQLIKSNIIKHEIRHDKVNIEFLIKQYDLLSEKRKGRQVAGSKGGNAKAMLKQKHSYKDKDKDNNKDKDKDNLNDFLDFWNLYPKKIAKEKCIEKWKKIKTEEKKLIFETLPNFKNYKPFETYTHPNPETYLNQKRWQDEIAESKQTYELSSFNGNHKFELTKSELAEKIQTGYWKLK